MNQTGFVELSHIKNGQLYRVSVPMGLPWITVREALLEMVVEMSAHIAEYEKAEKERLEAEAKAATNPTAVADTEIMPTA